MAAAAARATCRPPVRAAARVARRRRHTQAPAAEAVPASSPPHVPVLLDAVLAAFAPLPRLRTYVDCTLGAGGHAAAVVTAAAGRGLERVIGFDVDASARALAAARLTPLVTATGATLHIVPVNFRHLDAVLAGGWSGGGGEQSSTLVTPHPLPASALRPDAILIDCGFSSMQIDDPARGLSFSGDGPLDMRLSGGEGGEGGGVTAADIVNTWPEASLAALFLESGGEKHAKLAARRIVAARPLATTRELVAAIGPLGPPPRGGRRRAVHPATRVFQALRIAVNDEAGALEALLPAAITCLAPGGRVAAISFHSGEDGPIKRAFATAAGRPPPAEGDDVDVSIRLGVAPPPPPPCPVGIVVTKRPVVATDAEAAANPRARSAKLRVFQKFGEEEAAAAEAEWRARCERAARAWQR